MDKPEQLGTQYRNEINYGQDLLILILHVQDALRNGQDAGLALQVLRGSLLDEVSTYVDPQIEKIINKYTKMYDEIIAQSTEIPYPANPEHTEVHVSKENQAVLNSLDMIMNNEILNRIINALYKFGLLLQTAKHVECGKEPIYKP